MSETKQEAPIGCDCLCGGNGPKLTALAAMLLPTGEAGKHFRQAQLEMLKGLRAVLDQRIEAMSQATQGTKLSVD